MSELLLHHIHPRRLQIILREFGIMNQISKEGETILHFITPTITIILIRKITIIMITIIIVLLLILPLLLLIITITTITLLHILPLLPLRRIIIPKLVILLGIAPKIQFVTIVIALVTWPVIVMEPKLRRIVTNVGSKDIWLAIAPFLITHLIVSTVEKLATLLAIAHPLPLLQSVTNVEKSDTSPEIVIKTLLLPIQTVVVVVVDHPLAAILVVAMDICQGIAILLKANVTTVEE